MHRRPGCKAPAAYSAALALSLVAFAPAWAAESVDVKLGYSEVIRTEQPPETVIVGNDQVANATIAAPNTIVVTGNALGSTNLILLDEAGAEVSSSVVRVLPVDPRPRHAVRLISGGENQGSAFYVCGPEPACTETRNEDPLGTLADSAVRVGDVDDEANPDQTPGAEGGL